MNNNDIFIYLEKLHNSLNMNRFPTEYTANEGSRDAGIAISLLRKWEVDDNVEIKNLVQSTIINLELAIKAADKYYEDYNFSKRKHNNINADPFESVKKAQGAIGVFLFYIRENM